MKSIHELKLRISERFVIVYSVNKLNALKRAGFSYLFKCIHEQTGKPFWVFDVSYEIRQELYKYNLQNKMQESTATEPFEF